MRYTQIEDLIDLYKPSNVLEVGTLGGERALILCKHGAYYNGFDLFEDGTPELDKQEFNGKKRHQMKEVESLLKKNKVDFTLHKGNTRETLPEFAKNNKNKIDFAWIDGGHSVETIQSDWDSVKECLTDDAVVLFDDYYYPEIPGMGCNRVVSELKHTILPKHDFFPHTGFIAIVRVFP